MAKNDELARQFLEVIPPLMHQIRVEARVAAKGRLTIPQFRILANIRRGICQVGQIAEYQGVSQPAMSKMVDGLVKRGLVKRVAHASDRRQQILQTTAKGAALFQKMRAQMLLGLSERFSGIVGDDRRRFEEALLGLGAVFSTKQETP